MTNEEFKCTEHSGLIARIENLEKTNVEQWKAMSQSTHRIDAIVTRLNIVLGGIIVAVVMLLINLFVIR